MGKYILNRLAQGVLLIITVSILTFSLVYLMPGTPVEIMAGDRVSEEKIAELTAKYGYDKPLYVQYLKWAGNALKFDFGTSVKTKISVKETLSQRVPITLKLCGSALIIKLLIAVPLGLLAAYHKDSIFDRLLMAITSLLRAVPNFWVAILLILLFGVKLKWLPLSGYSTPMHMILPVISIVLGSMATTVRVTKAEVLEVFREKYVQTAFAKGLPRKTVVIKHVLRNALILVVTLTFMALPWIVSGSVIIENVFLIPGMGSILTNSISNHDFPVVQACVLIIATLTVLCNILCDIITAMLDPRIRDSISGGGER
jgi:peptide/nickel transport system permease protein